MISLICSFGYVSSKSELDNIVDATCSVLHLFAELTFRLKFFSSPTLSGYWLTTWPGWSNLARLNDLPG